MFSQILLRIQALSEEQQDQGQKDDYEWSRDQTARDMEVNIASYAKSQMPLLISTIR